MNILGLLFVLQIKMGKTGKSHYLGGRSWKIPSAYVSLIPGMIFSRYEPLEYDTQDNVTKNKNKKTKHGHFCSVYPGIGATKTPFLQNEYTNASF
jgi:hypothetical protein